MTLLLDGNASLALTPKAYLFQSSKHGQGSASVRWCLGLLDGGPSTATIGAITIRDVAVTFDNAQQQLSFRPVHSCVDFTDDVRISEASWVQDVADGRSSSRASKRSKASKVRVRLCVL